MRVNNRKIGLGGADRGHREHVTPCMSRSPRVLRAADTQLNRLKGRPDTSVRHGPGRARDFGILKVSGRAALFIKNMKPGFFKECECSSLVRVLKYALCNDEIFVVTDLDGTPQNAGHGLQFNKQLLHFKYYRAGPGPGHPFTDLNRLRPRRAGLEDGESVANTDQHNLYHSTPSSLPARF